MAHCSPSSPNGKDIETHTCLYVSLIFVDLMVLFRIDLMSKYCTYFLTLLSFYP